MDTEAGSRTARLAFLGSLGRGMIGPHFKATLRMCQVRRVAPFGGCPRLNKGSYGNSGIGFHDYTLVDW